MNELERGTLSALEYLIKNGSDDAKDKLFDILDSTEYISEYIDTEPTAEQVEEIRKEEREKILDTIESNMKGWA